MSMRLLPGLPDSTGVKCVAKFFFGEAAAY